MIGLWLAAWIAHASWSGPNGTGRHNMPSGYVLCLAPEPWLDPEWGVAQ